MFFGLLFARALTVWAPSVVTNVVTMTTKFDQNQHTKSYSSIPRKRPLQLNDDYG